MKNNNKNELQQLQEENRILKEQLKKKENCMKLIKRNFHNFLEYNNSDKFIDKMFSIFERYE